MTSKSDTTAHTVDPTPNMIRDFHNDVDILKAKLGTLHSKMCDVNPKGLSKPAATAFNRAKRIVGNAEDCLLEALDNLSLVKF